MSIFNTGSPLMAGGGKVATWTGSGTSTNNSVTTSISFNVSAEPTEWLLICAGAPSVPFSPSTTSYLCIMTAYYGDFSGNAIADTYVRYYSSGSTKNQRIYADSPSVPRITHSYSNNVITLTCGTNRYFMLSGNDGTYKVTYYLFYNTN